MMTVKQKRGFFAHIHAPRITQHALRFRTTWGLGVLLCVLFFILAGTGILLGAVYEPALNSAYDSVWEIAFVYPHGSLIRSVHYMAGNAFIIVSVMHLLRVILAVAFTGERYHNYLYGLFLFGMGFGALATGYFLPMTEIAYWALIVGVSLFDHIPWGGQFMKGLVLGGKAIGDTTIVRLYVLHVAVLPISMLAVISLHLWRIRKDKGLIKPKDLEPDALKYVSFQSAVKREWTIFFMACLILVLAAMVFPIGMDLRPIPAHPPNPVKAAWFFIALQETLSYSVLWGGIVPGVLLIMFFFTGPKLTEKNDKSPALWRHRIFTCLTLIILLAYAGFTLTGLYCRGANWRFISPYETIRNVVKI